MANKALPRHGENAGWYFALIFILTAGFAVWIALSLRMDVFTESLKRDDAVSVLLVIDDGSAPALTQVLVFHPRTMNGALIVIPKETGALLSSVDRVDRLETLYSPEDTRPYARAAGEFLGRGIDFTVHLSLDEFERLIDLIGGIDLFIPNAVDDEVDGRRFLFPPGGVSFDGAKARSYVEYNPPGEHADERTEREHRIIQSMLGRLGAVKDFLLSERVFPYVFDTFGDEFDERSLESFLTTVAGIDTDRLVLQGVLGNRRLLDDKVVLFPYYDGKLVKETLGRIVDTLAREDDFDGDRFITRVEILNGTNVNGLASRTAALFRSYGFRVAAVRNADRSDYERTVVLDRRGNPEAASRAAALIRCDRIHSSLEEERDQTVDITIILGKDFDGRYVRR